MKIFKEGRAKEKPPISDFPSLATHIPVFSQQALNALKEVLDRNGQLLPLDCDEGEYFAFNVTRLCDAFDRNSSSFYELPGGGIIDVKKYVLLANRIKDEPIFKVPQLSTGQKMSLTCGRSR